MDGPPPPPPLPPHSGGEGHQQSEAELELDCAPLELSLDPAGDDDDEEEARRLGAGDVGDERSTEWFAPSQQEAPAPQRDPPQQPQREPQQEQQPEQPSQQSQEWKTYATVFTNQKAGMDDMVHSKEHIQRTVYEMSKNSAHFKNERRKEAAADERSARMRSRLVAAPQAAVDAARRRADAALSRLEQQRYSGGGDVERARAWCLFDIDQFFFAVHALRDPSLHAVPVGVGGIGMLSTANYAARKYGVRAAMPGFIALALCPQLKFVASDFPEYTRVSRLFRDALREFDPDGTAYQAGLDECYVDLTAAAAARGESPAETAAAARAAVKAATGITVSAGIAPSRALAKVCSDINKPDGQFVLPPERDAVMSFTRALPLRKIGGIGRMAERSLRSALGVGACGELFEKRGELMLLQDFWQSSVPFYLRVMNGCFDDSPPARDGRGRKGMSEERTFRATSDIAVLGPRLDEIASHLAKRLVDEDLQRKVGTLTLKVKWNDYVVRQSSLAPPAPPAKAQSMGASCGEDAEEAKAGRFAERERAWLQEALAMAALQMLREHARVKPIRLLGLRASGFEAGKAAALATGQQTLEQAIAAAAQQQPTLAATPGAGSGAGAQQSQEIDLDAVDVSEQENILRQIEQQQLQRGKRAPSGAKGTAKRAKGQKSLQAFFGKRSA